MSPIDLVAEIDGIRTEPQYVFHKPGVDFPPQSTTSKVVYFHDDFLSSILGYHRDEVFRPVSIEVAELPSVGSGPDWERLLASRPSAVLGVYCEPVKRGVLGVLF